jgi:hypothetical protein
MVTPLQFVRDNRFQDRWSRQALTSNVRNYPPSRKLILNWGYRLKRFVCNLRYGLALRAQSGVLLIGHYNREGSR